MSDEQEDPSQKTEDPTHQRLEKAREKGQVALSKEWGNCLILATATFLVASGLPDYSKNLAVSLGKYFERSSVAFADAHALMEVLKDVLWDIMWFVGIPGIILMSVSIAGGLAQSKLLISTESLKPKLDKLSPFKGIKRLFGSQGLVEFLKTALKFSLVCVITHISLQDEYDKMDRLLDLSIPAQMEHLQHLTYTLFLSIACMTAGFTILDYAYQKYQFFQKMKMSRQEIKDEMKESEGDPHIKQRLRQLRHAQAQKNLAKDVASSTVIVTNPTHYAVALRYEISKMNAPLLVAKGIDHRAQHIKKLAQDAGIPLVEDVPLARSLYASVKEGAEIPMEYYEAVAKIMRYILKIGLKSRP